MPNMNHSVLANIECQHEQIKSKETPSECTLSDSLQILKENNNKNLLVLHSDSSRLVSNQLSDYLTRLIMFLSH